MSNHPGGVLKTKVSCPHPGVLNVKIVQRSTTTMTTKFLIRNCDHILYSRVLTIPRLSLLRRSLFLKVTSNWTRLVTFSSFYIYTYPFHPCNTHLLFRTRSRDSILNHTCVLTYNLPFNTYIPNLTFCSDPVTPIYVRLTLLTKRHFFFFFIPLFRWFTWIV